MRHPAFGSEWVWSGNGPRRVALPGHRFPNLRQRARQMHTRFFSPRQRVQGAVLQMLDRCRLHGALGNQRLVRRRLAAMRVTA